MGGGIEFRDSVVTGDVSINTNPIRVECPSCKKSGLLILHPCKNTISAECFQKICDTCFDTNSVCKPCLEEASNRDFQQKKSELIDKIAKNQALIDKFKQKLWDNNILLYCTIIGAAGIILSLIAMALVSDNSVAIGPMSLGVLLICPWFYGGIAYLWVLGKRDLLVIQLDEMENK